MPNILYLIIEKLKRNYKVIYYCTIALISFNIMIKLNKH